MEKQNVVTFYVMSSFVIEILLNKLKEVPYYTTLFNESYNKISKKWICRFAFNDTDKEFLGKASAGDDCFSSLDRSKAHHYNLKRTKFTILSAVQV